MASVNEGFQIPNERASELSKRYSVLIKPLFDVGMLSESKALEIMLSMNDLTIRERIWLAYHVGGINRMILYAKENAKEIVIQW